MPLDTRQARSDDVPYLARAMVSIPMHIERTDPYVVGLPTEVTPEVTEHVRSWMQDPASILLMAEIAGSPVGCLIGQVGETSFPPAGVGVTGHISVTWVEPDRRGEGIAQTLVSRAEDWFASKGVGIVEVSYLAANELATGAWSKLGYDPFRVFAFKSLG